MSAPGPPREPSTTVLIIDRSIARVDFPGLCERARTLLEGIDVDLLVCDVGAIVDPDAVTIDALARLQLTARRLGRQVQLRNASEELRELLTLMGLSTVVPLVRLSPRLRGQAKEREQLRGVEEEADPADPTGG